MFDWLAQPLVDVRRAPRWVTVMIVMYHTLFTGIIYGFSALLLMMAREGLFSHLCAPGITLCEQQNLQFTIIFNMGVVGHTFGTFGFGAALDRFGPRRTAFCGALLACLGVFLFAMSDPRTFNLYAVGYLFMGLAIGGIQAPLFQFSNLFVRRSQIISIMPGGFNMAGLVLPILDAAHSAIGATTRSVFLAFLVVQASLLVTTFVFMPEKSISSNFLDNEGAELEDRSAAVDASFDTACSSSDSSPDVTEGISKVQEKPLGRTSRMFPLPRLVELNSFRRQLLSVEGICALIYFGVQVLRFNFYLATGAVQLASIGDDGSYAAIFPWIPPIGTLATPLNGVLMDRFGIFVAVLVNTVGLLALDVTVLSGKLGAQGLTFALFALVRPLHFASLFSFMSKFGFANYGKLIGIAQITYGVLNQLQFAFLELAYLDVPDETPDSGSPSSAPSDALIPVPQPDFFAVNAIFLATSVAGFAFVALIWWRIEREEKRIREEAESSKTEKSR